MAWFMAVYHKPNYPEEAKFAKELHERIRREFPEVNKLFQAVLLVICEGPDFLFSSFVSTGFGTNP